MVITQLVLVLRIATHPAQQGMHAPTVTQLLPAHPVKRVRMENLHALFVQVDMLIVQVFQITGLDFNDIID